MYVVSYEIIGDAEAPETGTASAFELAPVASSSDVPTVRGLWEGFPYEGRFHFRAKVPCGRGSSSTAAPDDDYAWLDLTDADAPLPVWREDGDGRQQHVHVRVLPLSLPPLDGDDAAGGAGGGDGGAPTVEGETLDYSGGDLDDDILEASYGSGAMPEQQDEREQQQYHRRRQQSGGSGGGGGGGAGATWANSLKEATETVLTSEVTRDVTRLGKQVGKQVGKGVNKFFKAVIAAAVDAPGGGGGGGGGGNYPASAPAGASHAAIKTLRALEEAVGRTPNADMLAALWQALFPDSSAGAFAARSSQWRAAGFAGDDPLADLRGTGTLAVQCILHFAREHPALLAAILREQAPRGQAHYPFAAVANSLALMLVDVFKLRDGRYANVQAVFWGLFEGGRGAGAVEEIFCPCLAYLDRRWNETGATREQFASLIQDTRRRLENVLGQGPATLAEFGRMAEAGGLYVD